MSVLAGKGATDSVVVNAVSESAPDAAEVATQYFRALFVSPDEHARSLKPAEQAWLRAQRRALRGEGDSLSAMVPRLPSAMPRLLAATRDPDKTSARALARLVEDDPVLSAKVLKVVNSPSMRLRREAVDSIEQAIVVMGFPGMRAVIAAACISPIADFRRDSRLDAAAVQQLWPHTLEVAMAARQAAIRAGQQHAFELYVAALCHGSGLMLLLRRLRHLEEPMPGLEFIGALDGLAKRFAVVVARGWKFPEPTLSALESWSEGAPRRDSGADILGHAAQYVQARALVCAGVLDDEQWQALRMGLPGYAQDWPDIESGPA
ncbi:HDOD domain-containing protein [Wenzhouxiangella sp. AB-CW3]|nr:HDOD domain-containing protein [Wenzhouxiangella sp. AB-CW3]